MVRVNKSIFAKDRFLLELVFSGKNSFLNDRILALTFRKVFLQSVDRKR